jgi:hypothetical protein
MTLDEFLGFTAKTVMLKERLVNLDHNVRVHQLTSIYFWPTSIKRGMRIDKLSLRASMGRASGAQ